MYRKVTAIVVALQLLLLVIQYLDLYEIFCGLCWHGSQFLMFQKECWAICSAIIIFI